MLVHVLYIAAWSPVSLSEKITTNPPPWRHRMSNNNNPVGIVVHINEDLQHDQMSKLETSLGSDSGIKGARINRDRKHLMLVDYMPSMITARQVINYVKNKGYNAVLVGWI